MKYIIKRFLTVLLILPAPILLLAQTKTTFDRFKNTTQFMTAETPTSKVTFDGGKDAPFLSTTWVWWSVSPAKDRWIAASPQELNFSSSPVHPIGR